MSDKGVRITVGGTLLAFPLLLQIPYGLLALRFGYPAILREAPELVLERFAAGGSQLMVTWYLFGILILPLLLAMLALPLAVSVERPRALSAVTGLGVISAVLQMIGLLRWVFLVPVLAGGFVSPSASEPQRQAILIAFQAQHQLFGVMIGEHLGQLFLASWTVGIALVLPAQSRLQKAHRLLGLFSSLLFVLGLADGLSTVFPIKVGILSVLPGIAFLFWCVWCGLLGGMVATGAVHSSPPAKLAA